MSLPRRGRLSRAALAADLRERAFAGSEPGRPPRRLGAEVELIPVDTATGRRCPIEAEPPAGPTPATLPFLRRYAAPQGWREDVTSKGSPRFTLPAGGNLTFEPGGQLEFSSPACRTASALLGLLRSVIPPLRASAESEGISLLAVGIDPFNDVEHAPLRLGGRRYELMAEYLAARGPAGARMMRQTAGFQLSLDLDEEPWLRWRVLSAAAPYVTAIFANSSWYAGAATGCVSARAQVWRELDPCRTGLPYDARNPVGAYLDFALAAPAILLPAVEGRHPTFGEWLVRACPTREEWDDHLTTLFPEVRPRGSLELRSADTMPPRWYAAPLALAAGLAYSPRTLREAATLLGPPDPVLLCRVGRLGLHDPATARTASALFELALRGCAALEPGYFHPADLEVARDFFDRYTRRARSPADDAPADLAA